MDLLPPEPPYELLHTRNYEVRTYRKDASTLLMRGAVQDRKPAGLYIEDDPEELAIHHMIVELEIRFPEAVITRADVLYEDFPHTQCPSIAPHYGKLVGLSVMRGYGAKVRELFGGPRGCTHITALLQAMGPVVNQSAFSMRMAAGREAGVAEKRGPLTPEQREMMFRSNINTCHVWDEEGEHVQAIRSGESTEIPVWITKRYAKLGRPIDDWHSRLAESPTGQ